MYRHILFGALLACLAAAAPAAERYDIRPIEEVDLPAGAQGSDMIYLDPETAPGEREADELRDAILPAGAPGAALDLLQPMHPLYTQLRRGLVRYRQRWGALPAVDIESGAAMKAGQEGERIAQLRRRLGLPEGTRFDKPLAAAVREFQQAHGLKADGIVDVETLAALNRGTAHYEQLILANMERSRALPADARRYVLVDAVSARLWLYENGKPVETMKVIVGAPDASRSKTPEMAAAIRYVEVNPYWNIPPDLVEKKIAPRVLSEGISYFHDSRYEVLSDWSEAAQPVDPATIDWAAVAEGREELRVRQLPGGNNFMGKIKFMMPNDFGIYLHDTPARALFDQSERWLSNGCVRVENAAKLAEWLFGGVPEGKQPEVEERIELPEPVPVYITYFTAAPEGPGGSIAFRRDPYERDPILLARLFGAGTGETASAE